MSKVSTYVLFSGILLGCIAAILVCFMALDHNPQRVYTDTPEQLALLLYGWISAVSFPFMLIATVIELVRKSTKRARQFRTKAN